MASASMDDAAASLLALLKKQSVPPETKLAQLNSLKSYIKHQRIPETAQAPTVECIRLAIASQTSSSLVTAGLATLAHLIKRLTLQDQLGVLFSQRSGMIPVLLDRLGDAKESYRHAAFQALCDAWSARPTEVERVIKDAIQGTNARAKEEGMKWVAKMHGEHEMQFRGFVAPIVERLEDADGTIRQAAKNTLVDLFRAAPDRAKADLKRQLLAFNVRKSIASDILAQLRIPYEQGALDPGPPAPSGPSSRAPVQHHESAALETSAAEPVLPPSAETTHIEPLYVQSSRELEQIFTDMMPCFEGKETEHNWMARDKNVLKLRRYTRGNAPTDYQTAFVLGIKSLQDGILKVSGTLRTTMSSNGCNLVQELAKTLGPALDPLVELFMQSFIKMSSATKNISAQNGNTTVDAILANVPYHLRLSQHVWFACQDKNVQPRSFATGWLKTLIERHGHNKAHFEHSGGLELTEKSIKKGLADANPKVREGMRKTFWIFAQVWPDKGEAIASTLDAKSRQLLDKENPKGAVGESLLTSSVGPGPTANPRAATTKASSASLKDAIAAQKKALAARKAPDRPNSAMANLSPTKPERTHTTAVPSSLSITSNARVQNSLSTGKVGGASSSTGQGSLMSAPMRRPRRLETQRPATADPYANQKFLRNDTPSGSPKASPGRPVSKSSASSATSGHVKSKSTTSNMQPAGTGSAQSSRIGSPRLTPSKVRPRTIHGIEQALSSPRNPVATSHGRDVNPAFLSKHEAERPTSSHSSLPSMVEEDNLTLVMPSKTVPIAPQNSQGANSTKPEINTTSQGEMLDKRPTTETLGDGLDVYEDPMVDSAHLDDPAPQKAVLEELALNERNITRGQAGFPPEGLASPLSSPTKKTASESMGAGAPDRTDTLKARRLLASGLERIRAKQLDAHGFRRLQELVKSNSQDPDIPFVELLLALLEYIDTSNETFKLGGSKAQSLKSQALGIIRAILVVQRREEAVRQHYPRSLCAVVMARRHCETTSSHLGTDLERTVEEILRYVGDQGPTCLDAVLKLAEEEPVSGGSGTAGRAITMCFGVLAKLLDLLQARDEDIGDAQMQRMGKLAVKFLDDADSDVRRADTEFCLELYRTFKEDGKGEFWKLLQGAREAQLNLVAYYLARQSKQPTISQPA